VVNLTCLSIARLLLVLGDVMKVILQQNVVKLGKAGDVVDASAGYYRNFLQPRKLAVLATDGAMKKREEDLDVLRKKAEKAHQEATDLADKITALGKLTMSVRVGEGGKVYGKITIKEIAKALIDSVGVDIDKRLIRTGGDINALGSYKVTVKQSADVQSVITLEVVPENQVDYQGTKQTEAAKTPAE
jgi:large subunit ribosomal protein L9